jgi:acetylornithine/succinyldiaminopimelate/putrescine aminotransferase
MKHQRTLFAAGVIAPRRARPTDDMAELRRIRELAADLVRLDAEKHRAITTGTGAELQEAADRYSRTWQALKQAVAA